MEDNLFDKKCTGCGACMYACPMNCISMKRNSEGFSYPVVNEEKCIRCNKCKEKCTENIAIIGMNRTYAAWNNANDIKRNSSSGGIFYQVAKRFIESGGVVYGASFNTDFSVSHKRVERIEEIRDIMGSKYVQSDISKILQQVMDDAQKGQNVLFSGTPCQVNAVKKTIKNSLGKIYGVGVICHGTPSPGVWEKYVKLKKGQYGEDNIKGISFRDKSFGWNDFCLKMEFSDHTYLEEYRNDLYMQGFLTNLYLRESCYDCQFKGDNDVSDLILGDFWGIEKIIPDINSYHGISCVIVRTNEGKQLFDMIEEDIEYRRLEYYQALSGNSALEKSVYRNKYRDRFFADLKEGLVEDAIKRNLNPEAISDKTRYEYIYPIMYKYLNDCLEGVSIWEAIEERGFKNVVLYGVTDILKVFLKDLGKSSIINVSVADRRAMDYKEMFPDYSVLNMCEIVDACEKSLIDCIIICNPLRETQIRKEMYDLEISNEIVFSAINFLK